MSGASPSQRNHHPAPGLEKSQKEIGVPSGKNTISVTSEFSYPAQNDINMRENRCARQDQR
jgi:hypothetical protein